MKITIEYEKPVISDDDIEIINAFRAGILQPGYTWNDFEQDTHGPEARIQNMSSAPMRMAAYGVIGVNEAFKVGMWVAGIGAAVSGIQNLFS